MLMILILGIRAMEHRRFWIILAGEAPTQGIASDRTAHISSHPAGALDGSIQLSGLPLVASIRESVPKVARQCCFDDAPTATD